MRLWQLADNPQLFNQDEMVLGYDAWSIWRTGRDQHGIQFPVHFRSFNDYVPPVANYLAAPFVGLLGLNQFATRLPVALLGIATVGLTGLLGRRLFGPPAGLAAAGLLAFEPWHLSYSRIAFPAGLVPFFTVAAVYCFVRAVFSISPALSKRRAAAWFMLSGLCFGLLFMTYSTEKLNAPVLAGLCALSAGRLLWQHKPLAVLWITAAGLASAPVWLEILLAWSTVQTRFAGISVFSVWSNNWWIVLPFFYASYYDPLKLLVTGYTEGIVRLPAGVGQLLWVEGLLMFVALYRLSVRPPAGPLGYRRLLLGWFLTFPLAACLVTGHPHQVRSINFIPLPALLAGYGLVTTGRWWQAAGLRGRIKPALIGLMVALALGLNIWLLVAGYFPDKRAALERPAAEIPANLGLAQLAPEAAARLQPCDVLWLDNFRQSYMYYLFLTRYPPERFQQDPKELRLAGPDEAEAGFLVVRRFGQVYIGTPAGGDVRPPAVGRPGCAESGPGQVYWLTRAGPTETSATGLAWQEVKALYTSRGEPYLRWLRLD